jgi:putative transposase
VSSSEQKVVDLVMSYRKQLPRLGGRKLFFQVSGQLSDSERMGRDKFFTLLGKHGLLLKRRRRYARTTDSCHPFRVYKNLLKDKQLTRFNECWVADITYLRTRKGFVYLFLLTDAYSRKIVGWSLRESLGIEGGLIAMKMALKQRDERLPLIHHSDRGIQYCSKGYVELLRKNKVCISMTEDNHCYENALAERVNGILKQEFLLDATFKRKSSCLQSVKEAIKLYNEKRPHWSLNLKTPAQIHTMKVA